MNKIAFSILSVKSKNIVEEVKKALENGANWIHYDVMNKDFVNGEGIENIVNEEMISKMPKHFKDFHFMTKNPIIYFRENINIADSMTFHYEATTETERNEIFNEFLGKVKIGISINPDTSVEKIFPYLEKVDMVLLMSVIPGKGGQSFIENTLSKIKKLRKEIDSRNLDVIIEMDGGINNVTGVKCIDNGANVLVSGSYIARDYKNSINEMKKIL
ncbi:MAG: ribulose-phosphate 3-epimerase [Mycoplasma sp.]|nr:ribulose-phosphate 3-epimerase [Mycoplasma sp.]